MFTINQGLPKVPYLTTADKLIIGGFVFLFLAGMSPPPPLFFIYLFNDFILFFYMSYLT
jgi:hypothetical protein